METDVVVFWLVVLSCVSGLIMVASRLRSAALGWAAVYLVILLVSVIGLALSKSALIYAGLGLWLLLILLPGLLSRFYYQSFLQQRYATARRIARAISWLHPADGWREQPRIVHALELARQGDLTTALETLHQFQGAKTLVGLAAITNLYRITNQWEELLSWQAQNHLDLEQYPQLLPVLLRAHGEAGDLRGMVELYDRNKQRIAKLIPAASRDLCRLVLFAFCGYRTSVERLTSGSLAILPAWAKEFWLATADFASGASESAKRQFEALLPGADPAVRLAIERRLARISIRPAAPDASALRVIEEAAREHGHEESFGARPSLFSRYARATQLLIVLNVLMFIVEMAFGGATNGETLFRLGALFPPAVRSGQWWRLIASLFLHLGLLHVSMNMFALWVLGPFVEFALGFWRYLGVYLLAGIGSMAMVMTFASGEQLTVGASGCVMGLVGATGGLMLRGWLKEKAVSAKRRLISTLLIVGMQTVFDSLIPQVSMTAHLSGALFGFLITSLLRDRLTPTLALQSGTQD